MAGPVRIERTKEKVLIQSDDCALAILPQFGGKIASLRWRGRELLQAPLAPIQPRTQTMSFDEADASGWDECLPSVAACSVTTAEGPVQIPDHGDLWRVPWNPSGPALTGVSLAANCFSLPLKLERSISLQETDTGCTLSLQYKLTNSGNTPAPWSWAAHPLFAVEPGDRITLPAAIHKLRLEGSGGNRLGSKGAAVSWPIAEQPDGSQTDLSIAQSPESGIGDKLFAGPLAADENWCSLDRPSAGVRIRVRFDPAATPYLGLWMCYGGWPDRPGPRQTCVALEPSTAPVDSLAIQGAWSRTLAPGQSYLWPMFVDLENL